MMFICGKLLRLKAKTANVLSDLVDTDQQKEN